MKIAIIGAGNMGSSIAKGLIKKGCCQPQEITVSNPHKEKLEQLFLFNQDIVTLQSNTEAIRGAEIIILAVKPWIVEGVLQEIAPLFDEEKQVLVSVAAGVSFQQLSLYLQSDQRAKEPTLFRVIPNTAVEVLSSMTFVASYHANTACEQRIVDLFDSLGWAMLIKEEQMAAGMALASCGIAFAMRYIRAAAEGGVELGFYPKQATEIVLKTVKGAAELLLANQTHPEQEIDKVTTPGGITIQGLNEMEAAGFTQSVIRGLKKCHKPQIGH